MKTHSTFGTASIPSSGEQLLLRFVFPYDTSQAKMTHSFAIVAGSAGSSRRFSPLSHSASPESFITTNCADNDTCGVRRWCGKGLLLSRERAQESHPCLVAREGIWWQAERWARPDVAFVPCRPTGCKHGVLLALRTSRDAQSIGTLFSGSHSPNIGESPTAHTDSPNATRFWTHSST